MTRDRIKELRKVKASEIAPNPRNWRTHSDEQRKVFRGLLDEIGYAGTSLAYYSERAGGRLVLIDGHLRQEEVDPEFEMSVAITDLTDAEADKVLATFDPVSQLAGMDEVKFQALRAEIDTGNEAIEGLLDSLDADAIEAAVMSKTETTDEARDFTGSRNAIISYTIIFDNETQQTTWFQFLKRIKAKNPDTIAAGITEFIEANAG